jgi:hypothetical protein
MKGGGALLQSSPRTEILRDGLERTTMAKLTPLGSWSSNDLAVESLMKVERSRDSSLLAVFTHSDRDGMQKSCETRFYEDQRHSPAYRNLPRTSTGGYGTVHTAHNVVGLVNDGTLRDRRITMIEALQEVSTNQDAVTKSENGDILNLRQASLTARGNNAFISHSGL